MRYTRKYKYGKVPRYEVVRLFEVYDENHIKIGEYQDERELYGWEDRNKKMIKDQQFFGGEWFEDGKPRWLNKQQWWYYKEYAETLFKKEGAYLKLVFFKTPKELV